MEECTDDPDCDAQPRSAQPKSGEVGVERGLNDHERIQRERQDLHVDHRISITECDENMPKFMYTGHKEDEGENNRD